jgi:hypothetical protein
MPWQWGGRMTDGEEKQLPRPQTQDHGRRCPACAAFPRLTLQFLDSRTGRTIRLFKCETCGERIWDD